MPPRRQSRTQLATEAGWLELAITRQVGGGDGPGAIEAFADGTPGWFRAIELGMSLDHGPSVFASAKTLDADNAERRRQHEYLGARDIDRPKVVARAKRMSPDECNRPVRDALRD